MLGVTKKGDLDGPQTRIFCSSSGCYNNHYATSLWQPLERLHIGTTKWFSCHFMFFYKFFKEQISCSVHGKMILGASFLAFTHSLCKIDWTT
jgi:hypothetical protein